MLNLIAEKILDSKMAESARGAELVCMAGIAFTTILLGGVTSASILTFGPILNKIGAARNIHRTAGQTCWMEQQTAFRRSFRS